MSGDQKNCTDLVSLGYTEKQREAIECENSDILVSASAGSGKTSVMIERIVRLIEKGVPFGEIAVSTFTKAAASDIRAKLYKKLALLSFKQSVYDDALSELRSAQISTLHSWCQQIIKSHFYIIGCDPDFEIISPGEAAVLLRNAVTQSADEALTAGSPEFLTCYDVLLRGRSAESLYKLIESIYYFGIAQIDFDGFLDASLSSAAEHAKYLDGIRELFVKRTAGHLERADELYKKTLESGFMRNTETLEKLSDAIKNLETAPSMPRTKFEKTEPYLSLNEELKEVLNGYKKLYNKYLEAVNSEKAVGTVPYLSALTEVVRRAKAIYGDEKRKRGVLDYADLEHFTYKILKSDEAKELLSKKYRYVFVDEYQDINPLQAAILKEFTAHKFQVGDVKQSIYAFRMCDPRIFTEKYRSIKQKGGGHAVELNDNFRSRRGILGFCNAVFERVMTSDFGGIDYATDALLREGKAASESEKDIVYSSGLIRSDVSAILIRGGEKEQEPEKTVYSVMRDENFGVRDTSAESEYAAILNKIWELVSPEGNYDFKDITVLIGSRSRFSAGLIAYLGENGVPAVHNEKLPADSVSEIAVFIEILSYIDNSCNDIAAAAAMRSYYGGFTDDELKELRLFHPDGYFYEAVAAAAQAPNGGTLKSRLIEKVKAFLNKTAEYRRLSYYLTAGELMSRIAAGEGVFRFVSASCSGRTDSALLSAFIDEAEKSPQGATLGGYLAALKTGMPELETASGENAVRLMTVHASKGLEFPVVIMCDLRHRFNFSDTCSETLMDSRYGVALKYWDLDEKTKKKTALYCFLSEKKRIMLLEERMRILYVALTRAREKLILAGSVKDDEKLSHPVEAESFFDWLYPVIRDIADYADPRELLAKSFTEKMTPVFSKAPDGLVSRIKRYTEFVYPYKEERVKASVTALAKGAADESTDENIMYVAGGGSDDRALETGSAYHLAMEKADYSLGCGGAFDRVASDFPDEVSLVSAEKFSRAFEFFKDYLSGTEYYRELPFVAPLTVDGEKLLVQGIIDLLIVKSDGLTVIDYKTGFINSERFAAYKKQLAIYAAAAEKILKQPVIDKYIYAFESGELIKA